MFDEERYCAFSADYDGFHNVSASRMLRFMLKNECRYTCIVIAQQQCDVSHIHWTIAIEFDCMYHEMNTLHFSFLFKAILQLGPLHLRNTWQTLYELPADYFISHLNKGSYYLRNMKVWKTWMQLRSWSSRARMSLDANAMRLHFSNAGSCTWV